MRNIWVLSFFMCAWLLLSVPSKAEILWESNYVTSSEDTLYIIDFLLCRDVVEREPIDIVQSYTMDDERAWAFARIHNTTGMHNVEFRWFYEDEEYFFMDSRVGDSPNWRTYSSVTLQPGAWRVEILNKYGTQLREIRFHVSE